MAWWTQVDFLKTSKIFFSKFQVLPRESILASRYLENVWTLCGNKVTQRPRSRPKSSAVNFPGKMLWIFSARIQWGFKASWKKKKPSREYAQSIQPFIVSKKP